jgi:hypothetical protein
MAQITAGVHGTQEVPGFTGLPVTVHATGRLFNIKCLNLLFRHLCHEHVASLLPASRLT